MIPPQLRGRGASSGEKFKSAPIKAGLRSRAMMPREVMVPGISKASPMPERPSSQRMQTRTLLLSLSKGRWRVAGLPCHSQYTSTSRIFTPAPGGS